LKGSVLFSRAAIRRNLARRKNGKKGREAELIDLRKRRKGGKTHPTVKAKEKKWGYPSEGRRGGEYRNEFFRGGS